MYEENTFTPPPPASDLDKPKTPVLGIASFIAAIVSLLSVCAFFIFSYYLGSQVQYGNATDMNSIGLVGWVFICLISLTSLAGIGLGIAAVVQKGTSKVFGIIGLVLSSLILLGFCVFMIFAFGLALAAIGAY